VVGDQTRQPIICAHFAEKPAAVDGMETRIEQVRRVANVMEPCGCYEEISAHTRTYGQPFRLGGYGLVMLPPRRQRDGQLTLCEFLRGILTNHDRDSTR
jgi:hypothetical protein